MSVDPLTLIQNLLRQYQEFLAQNAKTLLGFNELALRLYAKKALKNDLEAKGYGIGIFLNGTLTSVIAVDPNTGNMSFESVNNPPSNVSVQATELPSFEVQNSNSVSSNNPDVTVELKLVTKDSNGNWTEVDEKTLWVVFAYADTVNTDVKCDGSGNITDYTRVESDDCFMTAGLGGKCDYVGYTPKYTLHGLSKVRLTPIPMLVDIESILSSISTTETSSESTETSTETSSEASTESTSETSSESTSETTSDSTQSTTETSTETSSTESTETSTGTTVTTGG